MSGKTNDRSAFGTVEALQLIGHHMPASFEVRFETPAGQQIQVDFAHFRVVFEDEQSASHVVWLGRRVLEVHSCAEEIRIFKVGRRIAVHGILERRHRRVVAAGTVACRPALTHRVCKKLWDGPVGGQDRRPAAQVAAPAAAD